MLVFSAGVYASRAVNSAVVLLLGSWFAVSKAQLRERLRWDRIRKLHLKGVVVVLLLAALLIGFVADVLASYAKYQDGPVDTCKGACTNSSDGGQLCHYLPHGDCPMGIVLRHAVHHSDEADADSLEAAAEGLWSLSLALHSAAIFLFLATFNNVLVKLSRRKHGSGGAETQLLLAGAALSLPIAMILQYSFSMGSLARFAAPRFLFAAQWLIIAVLLFKSNSRVHQFLQLIPRNYERPRGAEAALMFLRYLSRAIIVVLLVQVAFILTVTIGVIQSAEWTSSFAVMETLGGILNLTYLAVPFLLVFVMYRGDFATSRAGQICNSLAVPTTTSSTSRVARPTVLVRHGSSKFNSHTAQSALVAGSPRGLSRQNSSGLSSTQARSPATKRTDPECDGQELVKDKNRSCNESHHKVNKVYVNREFEASAEQGTYLLNALLQADSSSFRDLVEGNTAGGSVGEQSGDRIAREQRVFRPVSEAQAEEEAQHKSDADAGGGEEDRAMVHSMVQSAEVTIEEEESDFSLGDSSPDEAQSTDVLAEFNEFEVSRDSGSDEANVARRPRLTLETDLPVVLPGESEEPQGDAEAQNEVWGAVKDGMADRKKNTLQSVLPECKTSVAYRPGPSTEERFWQQSKVTNERKRSSLKGVERIAATGKVLQHVERQGSGSDHWIEHIRSRVSFSKTRSLRSRLGSLTEELTSEKRFELAGLWLSDAIANREPKLHRIAGLPIKVYKFVFSTGWRSALYILLVVQLLVLPFLEPENTSSLTAGDLARYPNYSVALHLDLFISLVFLLDALLLLYALGVRELQIFGCVSNEGHNPTRLNHRSVLFHLRLAVSATTIINIVAALADPTVFRFDRLLRNTMIVFFNRSVRNVFGDLLITSRDFAGVIATYVYVITIYGLVGIVLFNPEKYIETRNEFYGNATDTTEHLFRTDNFPWMSLGLYVMTTIEGFPTPLWIGFENSPALAFIYWISFAMVTVLFLQSIAVPLVYEPLQRRQRQRLVASKIAERKALVAAFEVLDPDDRYWLDHDTIDRLLTPFSSKHDAKVIMKLLDEDGNGKIDLLEFFQIVDSIKLKIRAKEESQLSPYVSVLGCSLQRRRFQAIKSHPRFSLLGDCITLAMIGVLMLYRIVDLAYLVTCTGLYLSFIFAETMIIVLAGSNSFEGTKKMVARVAWWLIETTLLAVYLGTGILPVFNTLQLLLVVHIYRVLRIARTLQGIVYVMGKLRGIMFTILLVVLCIMYGYVIFGMELFSQNRYTNHPSGSKADFDSFEVSFITVFQLVVAEGWNEIFYICAMSLDTDWGRWFLSVGYFLSFSLLVNIYILSIVLAIFLDAFLVFKDVKEDVVSEYVDESKAAKVLGIREKKYLLFKQRSLEETLYENFLMENSKNTIQELLDLGIIRNVGVVKTFTKMDRKTNRPVFNLRRYDSSTLARLSPSSRDLLVGQSSRSIARGGNASVTSSGLGASQASSRNIKFNISTPSALEKFAAKSSNRPRMSSTESSRRSISQSAGPFSTGRQQSNAGPRFSAGLGLVNGDRRLNVPLHEIVESDNQGDTTNAADRAELGTEATKDELAHEALDDL